MRAVEFGWDRIGVRVEAYYGFVIRRLAAAGALPAHFSAPIPPDRRLVVTETPPAPTRPVG